MPRSVGRRQGVSYNQPQQLDALAKKTGNEAFYQQASCLAHGPSFVRNLGLPLQWSSNRNREFNAWSQGHKDNPGVCQDYQGEIEQRRGKVVSAN